MISDFLVPAQGLMGAGQKKFVPLHAPFIYLTQPNLAGFRKIIFLDRQVPPLGHDPGDQMRIWSNMFNIFY